MELTTEQYLQAIDRELGKRATTYPKILKKMKKQGVEDIEFDSAILGQHTQVRRLRNARHLVETTIENVSLDLSTECLAELMRELKERKRCYPRWVKVYKMMTPETAAYEIAVWESLTRWFAKEYLDLDELPTKRKKKQ